MKKILLGILVIVFLLWYWSQTRTILPSTFTITMKGDFSSSGGDRKYDGKLTFKENMLMEGTSHYVANTATSQHIEYECMVKAGEWVKVESADRCEIPVVISLTKDGLEKQIQSGELVSAENCKHLQTCYIVVK